MKKIDKLKLYYTKLPGCPSLDSFNFEIDESSDNGINFTNSSPYSVKLGNNSKDLITYSKNKSSLQKLNFEYKNVINSTKKISFIQKKDILRCKFLNKKLHLEIEKKDISSIKNVEKLSETLENILVNKLFLK